MTLIRRSLRLLCLLLFLLLAGLGIGLTGVFLPMFRFVNKQILKEQVDKRKKEA